MSESPSWLARASDTIRLLADRPWTLLALLLALNALARPATITAHDARLYSLQALNQAEAGAYQADLFLRYGSQDQYSLFSPIVGPLVAALGLRPTFFLLYLVFNTLFVLALMRFVRALIADPVVATLSLVFLVTAPLSYGGHEVFMVHEQFFTPRIIATTLTLFALERLLRERYLAMCLLLALGLAVHPLMAFGGVMIAACFVACRVLPTRVFVAVVLLGTAALAVIAVPAAGARLFRLVDADWHRVIRMYTSYIYPDAWSLKDWLSIALSFVLLLLGGLAWSSLLRDDMISRQFCGIVFLAGAVGMATSLIATLDSYALLMQAQPYRILWIMKVMQVPLGFLLIARWHASPLLGQRLAALGLACHFCVTQYDTQELTFILWLLAATGAYGFFVERPGGRDGWWYAVLRGFVLGEIAWNLSRWWSYYRHRETLAQGYDLHEFVLATHISPVVWLVLLAFLGARAWQRFPFAGLRGSCVAVALTAPLLMFAAEMSATFQQHHTRHGADFAFVSEFIHRQRAGSSVPPAIYSSLGRPDHVWIDVRATSFYDPIQPAGVVFNRQTALEVDRRRLLVARFEMDRHRRQALFKSDAEKAQVEDQFQLRFDTPSPPTLADLVRLCEEPGLDYVVTPHEFAGHAAASNGRVWIYDCAQVRNRVNREGPAPPRGAS